MPSPKRAMGLFTHLERKHSHQLAEAHEEGENGYAPTKKSHN